MKLFKYFVLTLCLSLGAWAQASLSEQGGQFLTLRVAGAPAAATSAVVDLNSDLPGLLLHRGDDGVWSGGFVILPDMVHNLARPKVRLLDAAGEEISRVGVSVEMASSDFDQDGLATALRDRTACFVFDATVKGDSIRLLTDQGSQSPSFRGQTFSVPRNTASKDISAVVAQSATGADLVFVPDWSASTAGVEEKL